MNCMLNNLKGKLSSPTGGKLLLLSIQKMKCNWKVLILPSVFNSACIYMSNCKSFAFVVYLPSVCGIQRSAENQCGVLQDWEIQMETFIDKSEIEEFA